MHFLFVICVLFSKIRSQTANNNVPDFSGDFGFGMNPGYHGGQWTDEQLSDITLGNDGVGQKGIGCNALRLKLHEDFLAEWGYAIRADAFDHYGSLGALHNTIFLEEPTDDHQDKNYYCGTSGVHSKLWSSMWLPIFDSGGATPVNENNFLALYVYKVVSEYAPRNGRFWEIINEPDFTVTSHGWEAPGTAGNWWENDPDPCDLSNLQAPIEHYVRALRVAYEVIKSIDPTQYVCVGGVGYPSFIDAVLRNTDNPVDGSVTGTYPLKGGAYFDCLSYHNYPMYGLSSWNDDIGGWEYFRHSDKCVENFFGAKDEYQTVLDNHGYDGAQYPKKRFIVTETNVPSASFDNYIGSNEAQRNYVMKIIAKSPKMNVDQVDFFALSTSGGGSYSAMGFYQNLDSVNPYQQQVLMSGIGAKTAANMTIGKTYDPTRSSALNLPSDVEGFAFSDSETYRYVLWAKTNTDMSEVRELQYSFPEATFDFPSYKIYSWDYSNTRVVTRVSVSSLPITVNLHGYPIFIEFDNDNYVDPGGNGNNIFGSKEGEKVHPYDPTAAALGILFPLFFVCMCLCCCCCLFLAFSFFCAVGLGSGVIGGGSVLLKNKFGKGGFKTLADLENPLKDIPEANNNNEVMKDQNSSPLGIVNNNKFVQKPKIPTRRVPPKKPTTIPGRRPRLPTKPVKRFGE